MNRNGKGRYARVFAGLLLLVLLALAPAISANAAAVNTTKKEKLSGGKWVKKSGKWKYRKKNKKYAVNGFKKIDGYWYFINRKGNLLTGMRKLNGNYYYFQTSGGAGVIGRMKTGLVTVKGKTYFFRTSGKTGVRGARVNSNWQEVAGKNLYFKQDGTLYEGETWTETQFIEKIGKIAQADMKRSKILASVTIAQAILESNYGHSSLGMEANNLFGMKASLSGNNWKSSWDGKTFEKNTLEYLNGKWVTVKGTFRAYADISQSVKDHSDYLANAKNGSKLRYSGVVGNKSYKKTIKLIKKGGYATDPSYVTKICNIIKKYKLTKYDK